jgi:hypothetical protein
MAGARSSPRWQQWRHDGSVTREGWARSAFIAGRLVVDAFRAHQGSGGRGMGRVMGSGAAANAQWRKVVQRSASGEAPRGTDHGPTRVAHRNPHAALGPPDTGWLGVPYDAVRQRADRLCATSRAQAVPTRSSAPQFKVALLD